MTASDDERTVRERISALVLPGESAMWLAETIRPDLGRLADEDFLATEAAQGTMPDLTLIATLGEGGMGRVHLARQRSLDRDVAVKTLRDGAPREVAFALMREARIAGALEHPGVVPVHALGADSRGQPLLVMKRVEGADFSDLLADPAHALWAARDEKVDRLGAMLEILLQVCRTLELAHSRGIIHRDIKPANVMVGRYGEVYLLDWGIATKKGPADAYLIGTPGFMAPEMFLGGPVDERTDIYLLGATLHNMLTGTLRHSGEDIRAVAHSALTSEPIRYGAHVPPLLADLCNRATRRAADERVPSVAAFRAAVLQFLQHRDAFALCNAARERLVSFHALMRAAPPEGVPPDLRSAYRLVTEARFGFTQCVAAHPAHHEAGVGTREAIAALVDLELRQGHAESADAMLAELTILEQPPRERFSEHADARAASLGASLRARVAALRIKNESVRQETTRLEALGRDVDPTDGVKQRLVIVAASVAVSAVFGALALTHIANESTMWGAVRFAAFGIVFTAVISFTLRKWAFRSAFNRRLGAFFFLGLVFWLVDRIAAAFTGGTVEAAFVVDLWIMAASLSAGAVAVERRLVVSVLPFIAGALAIRAYPARMSLWFSLTMILGTASLGAVIFLQSRRETKRLADLGSAASGDRPSSVQ